MKKKLNWMISINSFQVEKFFTPGLIVGLILAFFLTLSCTDRSVPEKVQTPELNIVFLEQAGADPAWPDQALENAFSRYWHDRFAGTDTETLLKLEAPHVREMVAFEKYRSFMRTVPASKIKKIEISRLVPVTDYLVELAITVNYTGPDNLDRSFSQRDRWVLVDDKWYHVFRDPLAFPEISGIGFKYKSS